MICQIYALGITTSLSFSSSQTISKLPDCIVNLDHLQSVSFRFSSMTSLPVGFLSMPSIAEVGIFSDDVFDVMAFLDLINQTIFTSSDNFTWHDPSQTTYLFVDSLFCTEIMTLYDTLNTRYDDYINIEILKKFINQTNTCAYHCNKWSFDKWICSPFDWQNGVCNQECNVAECYYDGGDCNQLCFYGGGECSSVNFFDNGLCDIGCNTSACDYDKYECLSSEASTNISFSSNMTYCNKNVSNITNLNSSSYNRSLCDVAWVSDTWCDNNCQSSENCFYDGDDCICDESNDPNNNCQQLLTLFAIIGDTTGDNDNACLLSVNSVCTLWDYLTLYDSSDTSGLTSLEAALLMSVEEYYELYPNCTVAFERLDINGDKYFDPHEFVVVFAEAFNFTNTKAIQVNCTFAYDC